MRAGPSRGALPLTPQLGLALADHLGARGRGDVRTLDLGILADFLPPELAGTFPVVKVESTEDGAEEGRAESAGTPSEVPARAGAFELHARAGRDPFGESTFRGGPWISVASSSRTDRRRPSAVWSTGGPERRSARCTSAR